MTTTLQERVHLRMPGSNPGLFLGEAPALSIALDAAARDPPGAASLTLRHGSNRFLVMNETVDTVGTVGASIRSGRPGNPFASLTIQDRLKVGPDGTVTDDLIVTENAHVMNHLVVAGDLNATAYTNLVDSFTSPAIFQPPTAGALGRAYVDLSNLVAYHVAARSTTEEPDWVADAMQTGPVACTDLYVLSGGAVRAGSYCNLVHDFRALPTQHVPPSAYALNAAYVQLSNYVVLQLRDLRETSHYYHRHPMWSNALAETPGATLVPGLTAMPSDLWIQSAADGADRFMFATSGPTQFASPSSAASDAFRWLSSMPDGGMTELMTLSSTDGRLLVQGGAFIGEDADVLRDLNVGGNAALIGDLRVVGSVQPGAYCNLPVGTRTLKGIVRFAERSALDPEEEDAAATPALVAAALEPLDHKIHELRDLVAAGLFQSDRAHAMGVVASNQAYEYTLTRVYHDTSNVMTPGLRLQARSSNERAGVEARLENDVEGGVLRISMSSAAAGSVGMICNEGGGAVRVHGGPSKAGPPGANERVFATTLSVGQEVEIATGEAMTTVVPPDGIASADPVTGVYEDALGMIYVVEASSVFAPSEEWCQPRLGLSVSDGGAWLSAPGSYDGPTGAPTPESPAMTEISVAVGGAAVLRGQWIQFECSRPLFPLSFRLFTTSASFVPNDFALLASETQAGPWRLINRGLQAVIGQAAPLVAATADGGRDYDVDAAAGAIGFRRFRLVVTRIGPGTGSLVRLDAFKVRGSFDAPLPDVMLRVNGDSLVVDRRGYVGVSEAQPSAILHVGGGDGGASRAVVLKDADRDLPDAHRFRGWSTESNALWHRVEGPTARHAFCAAIDACNSLEVLSVTGPRSGATDGRVGVLCPEPQASLHVVGSARVDGPLTASSMHAVGCVRLEPASNALFAADVLSASICAPPSLPTASLASVDARLRLITEAFFAPAWVSAPVINVDLDADGNGDANGVIPIASLSNHVNPLVIGGNRHYVDTMRFELDSSGTTHPQIFEVTTDGRLIAFADLAREASGVVQDGRDTSGVVSIRALNPVFSTLTALTQASYRFSGAPPSELIWRTRVASLDGQDDVLCSVGSRRDGDVILTGVTTGNLQAFETDMENILPTWSPSSFTDAVITSYSSAGRARWQAGVTGVSSTETASAVSMNGRIYLVGRLVQAASSVRDRSGRTEPLPTTGPFLLQFNSDGNPYWIASMSTADHVFGVFSGGWNSVALVVGSFRDGPLTIGNGADIILPGAAPPPPPPTLQPLQPTGPEDIFVVAYNGGGIAEWAVSGEMTAVAPPTMSVDTDGSSVLGMRRTAQGVQELKHTDGRTWSFQSPVDSPCVFVRMSSSGEAIWAVWATHVTVGSVHSAMSQGHVYVSATHSDTAASILDASSTGPIDVLDESVRSSTPGRFVSLTKLSPSGTVEWVTRLICSSVDEVYGITVTTDGGVCVTVKHGVSLVSAFDVDGVARVTIDASHPGVYVVKYSSSGNAEWINRIQGSISGAKVAASTFGHVYVAGTASSNTSYLRGVDNNWHGSMSGYGGKDMFIVKYA
jgi:hypothetical protein